MANDSVKAQFMFGNTDSLFVCTGLDDLYFLRKLGLELNRDVKKKYGMLKMESDAMYENMILLKKE